MRGISFFVALLASVAAFANPAAEGCTDFSGEWAGACTNGYATGPASVSIRQSNCRFVQIDGQTYPIGGGHLVSDAVPFGAGFVYSSAYVNTAWDLTARTLVFRTQAYVVRNSTPVYADEIWSSATILPDGRLAASSRGRTNAVQCAFAHRGTEASPVDGMPMK